jgi:hypothetical protein
LKVAATGEFVGNGPAVPLPDSANLPVSKTGDQLFRRKLWESAGEFIGNCPGVVTPADLYIVETGFKLIGGELS